jgi:Fur family iron response transcriptional regulator
MKPRRPIIPVSLATVYNTLNQFTEAGLLRQLALDSSRACFDTNPTEHHQYILEDDGGIFDMPSQDVTVTNFRMPPFGMEVASVEVIVRLRRIKDMHGGV